MVCFHKNEGIKMTFKDIEIVGMDESASKRSQGPHSGLFEIVMKLSASAPSEWAKYFNASWQQHLYMRKRRAQASSASIQILCAPDELESDHMPELKTVITETNKAYRSYLEKVQATEEARRAAAAADTAVLQGLSNRLKN